MFLIGMKILYFTCTFLYHFRCKYKVFHLCKLKMHCNGTDETNFFRKFVSFDTFQIDLRTNLVNCSPKRWFRNFFHCIPRNFTALWNDTHNFLFISSLFQSSSTKSHTTNTKKNESNLIWKRSWQKQQKLADIRWKKTECIRFKINRLKMLLKRNSLHQRNKINPNSQTTIWRMTQANGEQLALRWETSSLLLLLRTAAMRHVPQQKPLNNNDAQKITNRLKKNSI